MHPGTIYLWNLARQRSRCGELWPGAGPGAYAIGWERHGSGGERPGDSGAGAFGVRRPLRFLAYKLELNEKQVEELARILNELKTERAQAEVDARRSLAAFADAIDSPTFDAARAGDGGNRRVSSAEQLRDALVKALQRIHALLDAEQRSRLAYLIRTGTLAL